MPIYHEWLVPDHALYNRIWGNFTEEEVEQSSQITVEYFDSATQPVFFIVDTLGVTSFPKNLVRVAPMTRAFITHPNMRQLIVVSDNAAIKFVTTIAAQVQRNKLVLYSSVDEALAYVGKQVPEIASMLKKPKT